MGNGKSGGPVAKVVAIGVVATLISAACSTATVTGAPPTTPLASAPSHTAPVASHASGCFVGEAWNNYAEERIALWDQPAIEKPIEAAGGTHDFVDAKSSVETQVTQIDEFVAKGADVIIVKVVWGPEGGLAQETKGAIDRAVDAGVPVIVYDYLVDSQKALLVAFDPVETGRMEARAILAARPKGNYAIIKGHPTGQLEPDLIASGIHEVLQPAIDKGDIKIVAETYTVNWDPYTAQTDMETILS